jgi:hypothetical protein
MFVYQLYQFYPADPAAIPNRICTSNNINPTSNTNFGYLSQGRRTLHEKDVQLYAPMSDVGDVM